MAGIFDPKNDLWCTVSAIADVCCMSLMWVIAFVAYFGYLFLAVLI